MANNFKICFDKILPRELNRPRSGTILQPSDSAHPRGGHPTRMAVEKKKLWVNGSILRVKFMEGNAEQKDIVKNFATEWSQFGNIKFDFNDSPNAEIRIAFEDDGAWSYIGTDCMNIPRNTHTMNFGWLDKAVVLHEFGHAMGMIHEHQNPLGGVQWNKPKVYSDLGGSPNFWDKETVDHNMFETYDVDQINGTLVDKKSIMLYFIPKEWTTDGFFSGENNDLSDVDKTFIGDSKNYPLVAKPEKIIELKISKSKAIDGEIEKAGEEDVFAFTVIKEGKYAIETKGNTDVLMNLYGPDSKTKFIARDNDSGARLNAKLLIDLLPGKYYIQIRHVDGINGTGKYKVYVSKKKKKI
jgi:hypothetical protein